MNLSAAADVGGESSVLRLQSSAECKVQRSFVNHYVSCVFKYLVVLRCFLFNVTQQNSDIETRNLNSTNLEHSCLNS